MSGWNLKRSYFQLPEIFYTNISPTKVKEPELVLFNQELAEQLGISTGRDEEENALLFAGNKLPPGAKPIAQAYAGHQFGNFTMLGDGRAISYGEQVDYSGYTYDIQLKGTGPTPYSRGGDGRAALGPMLREYIISEAMHALGVATSRGLAVVTTGESITREKELQGAILTRVASSYVRVGTFQYAVAWRVTEELKALADYTIEHLQIHYEQDDNKYLRLLETTIERQAKLIAQWQLVGFVHGVMNTDNMALSGETIDYGPCAFIDTYDKKAVFSSIDQEGRYAYGNQPFIGGWNLTRFAETLIPLLDEDEDRAVEKAQEALSKYEQLYGETFMLGMRKKLGLFNEEEADEMLIKDLLALMEKYELDYTNTFLELTFEEASEGLAQEKELHAWIDRWEERRERQSNSKLESVALMKRHNPAIIPRNHQVEEALEAAVKGDYEPLHYLMELLAEPYAHTDEQKEFAKIPVPSKPFQTYCGT